MFKRIMNYFSPISQPAKAILESFEEEARWVVKEKSILFPDTHWVLKDTKTNELLCYHTQYPSSVVSIVMGNLPLSTREQSALAHKCKSVIKAYNAGQSRKLNEEHDLLIEQARQKYMKLYVKPDSEQ